MRITRWRSKEVTQEITQQAMVNAGDVMDEVASRAKRLCPVSPIVRPGEWTTREIQFTARKGKIYTDVRFTGKVWTGREPGMLRDTIRRVDGRGRRWGNIRVYAGGTKVDPRVIWAHFVERGTAKSPAQPYLRPAFQSVLPNIANRIKHGKV